MQLVPAWFPGFGVIPGNQADTSHSERWQKKSRVQSLGLAKTHKEEMGVFFNNLDFMLTPVVFHGHNVVDVIDRIENFKQD